MPLTQKTFLLAAGFGLAMTLANSASAMNLLNNSSFEDDLGFDFSNVTNWNGFFGGPPGTFLEAFNDTGAPANSGSKALELTLDGDANFPTTGSNAFVGQFQQVPGISPGDYDLSAFLRNNGSSLTGNVEFRVEWYDAGDAQISADQVNLETLLTDEYQEFDRVVTAPAGTVRANIVFAVASFNQDVLHSNSVLVDDVSFSVVPEPGSLALLGLGACVMLRRRR